MKILKRKDVQYWIILLGVIITFFVCFSSQQFSFIFTAAGTIQIFGFILIIIRIRKSRSVVGLSKHMFINYTIVFGVRSILFMFYKGYLPFDSTGNVIFKIQQILATACSAIILYLIITKYRTSYDEQQDSLRCYYLIIIAIIFGVFFHSNLNRSFIGDFTWAFSQYLQTFAILSQFILFRNKDKQVQTYTSNFVATQAIARILSIFFWIYTYGELNVQNSTNLMAFGQQYVGHWFLISQLIHLVIMADFMYYWIKALIHGEQMVLPS